MVLAQYRQVDSLTQRIFRAPAGLVGRIQQACIQEAENQSAEQLWEQLAPTSPRQHIWRPLLATAAALVIVAFLSALLTAEFVRSDSSVASTAEMPALAIQPMPSYLPPLPAPAVDHRVQIAAEDHEGFSLVDSRRLQLESSHDADDLTMVSSTPSQPHSAMSLRQLILLPNTVEHVWISRQGQPPVAALQEIQRDYPELVDKLSEPDELGIVTLTLQMTDQRVQALVNALDSSQKWTLLSPGYPQPKQEDLVAFRDQPLQYTLKLLPAN